MANTAVTSVQTTINAQVELAYKAATADGANAAETFDITPAKKDGSVLVLIKNTATDQGTLTWSLAAGDMWASSAALTGSIAQGKTYALEVETAKYKQSDGTFTLTLTPASGKILLTNHAAAVACVQLR